MIWGWEELACQLYPSALRLSSRRFDWSRAFEGLDIRFSRYYFSRPSRALTMPRISYLSDSTRWRFSKLTCRAYWWATLSRRSLLLLGLLRWLSPTVSATRAPPRQASSSCTYQNATAQSHATQRYYSCHAASARWRIYLMRFISIEIQA